MSSTNSYRNRVNVPISILKPVEDKKGLGKPHRSSGRGADALNELGNGWRELLHSSLAFYESIDSRQQCINRRCYISITDHWSHQRGVQSTCRSSQIEAFCSRSSTCRN